MTVEELQAEIVKEKEKALALADKEQAVSVAFKDGKLEAFVFCQAMLNSITV